MNEEDDNRNQARKRLAEVGKQANRLSSEDLRRREELKRHCREFVRKHKDAPPSKANLLVRNEEERKFANKYINEARSFENGKPSQGDFAVTPEGLRGHKREILEVSDKRLLRDSKTLIAARDTSHKVDEKGLITLRTTESPRKIVKKDAEKGPKLSLATHPSTSKGIQIATQQEFEKELQKIQKSQKKPYRQKLKDQFSKDKMKQGFKEAFNLD